MGIGLVNPMAKRRRIPARRGSHNQIACEDDFSRALELLLAFDRSVVEFSMSLYKLAGRDRIAIREYNRRLHRLLRRRPPDS